MTLGYTDGMLTKTVCHDDDHSSDDEVFEYTVDELYPNRYANDKLNIDPMVSYSIWMMIISCFILRVCLETVQSVVWREYPTTKMWKMVLLRLIRHQT